MQQLQQMQQQISIPVIKAPIIQNHIIDHNGTNQVTVMQTTPIANIPMIKDNVPLQPHNTREILNHTPIIQNKSEQNIHQPQPPIVCNFKEPPPYSNLKMGGNKPTYKEWLKNTQKNPKHIISGTNDNNILEDDRAKRLSDLKKKYSNTENRDATQKNKIARKRLVKIKTKTFKYNLGKKGKTVSVLIKNNHTRKKINDEFAKLKITPIRTPSAAPAEVPRIAGSAIGLLVDPCARTPAKPKDAPTNIAAAMRGARISQMI